MVCAVELQTKVNEDYAKFYNHREVPYIRVFFWLKAPIGFITIKTLLKDTMLNWDTTQFIRDRLTVYRRLFSIVS